MAAKGLESFLAQVEQEPSLQEQLSKLDLQGYEPRQRAGF